jgi:ubiquinone/menaquinone biosynthesis C-methylase UbiE
MEDNQPVICDFYQNKYNEDGRMGRKPLEFLRCKEIILRYLDNENMEIADIGGATGAFSYWLAQMGHHVHLLDYVPLHIKQAKENGSKFKLQLSSYTCGDARYLPYKDNQFDVVLEMGPLYHLQSEDERMRCLSEAMRILKDDGTVLCEAISRYANLFEGFQCDLISDDKFVDILNENLENGKHSPGDSPYFTTAFFHTPAAMVKELEQAGFKDISLIAVEGFAFALNIDSILSDPIKKKLLLKYIRETENNPDLLGVSGHFIGVGRKAKDAKRL